MDEKEIWREGIHTAISEGSASYQDFFLEWAEEKCAAFGEVDWKNRREEARGLKSA